jgi:hypothetical protein
MLVVADRRYYTAWQLGWRYCGNAPHKTNVPVKRRRIKKPTNMWNNERKFKMKITILSPPSFMG